MSAALLLDTCAAIWIAGDERIAEEATAAINASYAADIPVYISPITAWEIGMLAARGRVALTISPQAWFERLLAVELTRLADMSPGLLISSSFLPGTPPRDPADRIIIATAREHDLTIVTRDRALLDYSEQGHVRTLAC